MWSKLPVLIAAILFGSFAEASGVAAVGSQAGGLSCPAAGTCDYVFPSNVTTGSLVTIQGCRWYPTTDIIASGDLTKQSGTATIGTITFDRGDSDTADGTDSFSIGQWSFLVTGGGSLTMRLGGTDASAYQVISGAEFSSATGWDSMRVAGVNSTSTTNNGETTADSGNASTTSSGVFVGLMTKVATGNPATITEDGAFTLIDEEENATAQQPCSAIRRIVTGATTDSGTWTNDLNNTGWAASVVAYQDVTAASSISMMRSSFPGRPGR